MHGLRSETTNENCENKSPIKNPPKDLQDHIGGGDFEFVGNRLFNHFLKYGELKPNETILDVGSGCGRLTIPLTKYMNKEGHYEGFDIDLRCVEWCRANISICYPNFYFSYADIFNAFYNKNGKIRQDEYVFPYHSDSFDFIFLTSVFTHMLPKDVEHYFSEISRVLKPNGRCIISFFLLNFQSRLLLDLKKCQIPFIDSKKNYYFGDEKIHEAVVAYEEDFILRLYSNYCLSVRDPIFYGTWSGREIHNNEKWSGFQDLIIATKM